MVERRAPAIVVQYPTRDVVHLKANITEEPTKRTVELEAPTTATSLDDLRKRTLDVGRDTSPVEHVEIFEGNRDEVRRL